MIMTPAIFWLIVAVVLAVIEIFTMGLVTIWFTIGAVAAMLTALLGASVALQAVAFVLVSTAVLVAVRPWASAYLNNRLKKTNIDAVVGRKLIVKSDIDNLKGTGKVDMEGSTWLAASSDDGVIIHKGEEVRVVRVKGAKLIVEREEN